MASNLNTFLRSFTNDSALRKEFGKDSESALAVYERFHIPDEDRRDLLWHNMNNLRTRHGVATMALLEQVLDLKYEVYPIYPSPNIVISHIEGELRAGKSTVRVHIRWDENTKHDTYPQPRLYLRSANTAPENRELQAEEPIPVFVHLAGRTAALEIDLDLQPGSYYMQIYVAGKAGKFSDDFLLEIA